MSKSSEENFEIDVSEEIPYYFRSKKNRVVYIVVIITAVLIFALILSSFQSFQSKFYEKEAAEYLLFPWDLPDWTLFNDGRSSRPVSPNSLSDWERDYRQGNDELKVRIHVYDSIDSAQAYLYNERVNVTVNYSYSVEDYRIGSEGFTAYWEGNLEYAPYYYVIYRVENVYVYVRSSMADIDSSIVEQIAENQLEKIENIGP